MKIGPSAEFIVKIIVVYLFETWGIVSSARRHLHVEWDSCTE